jgi:hypothetical protein
MRRGLLGCLAGLALMAGGCNSYKYFEIHALFDPATLDSGQTGYISSCWVTVSGADNAQFRLQGNVCPPPANSTAPLDIGTFEFSTFADGGNLTFKLSGYTGVGMMPNCKLAEGSTTVAVSGATTITGTLTAAKVGEACTAVTPPKGDGGT